MSGVVQTTLTDKELDILLSWADDGAIVGAEVDAVLLAKLQGYRDALDCAGPSCVVPRT